MGKRIFSAVTALVLFASFTVTAFALTAAPGVSAKSAVLVHADTGEVLFEKNADERMLIASTTKVMTALVVLENCDPDESVTVPEEAVYIEGSSMYLRAGNTYTVRELLYGLLLVSGNDAAMALALHVSGSTEDFAALMNEKASRLGLCDTAFANPHGLDAQEHYSTARELAVIMAEAMRDPVFREIDGTKAVNIGELTYVNHNKLLWNYHGVNGGKTGYTMASGRSLISSAERDGLEMICVTLNDPDDWADHAALYDWGFGDFEYRAPVPLGEYAQVTVVSGVSDRVGVAPGAETRFLLRRGAEIEYLVELPRFVFAELRAGERAGTIVVTADGEFAGMVPLYFTESVGGAEGIRLNAWERFRRAWFIANPSAVR